MFERNPIDNANALAIAVEITLDDGRTIMGRAALDRGTSVHKLLTAAGDFLYVQSYDGDDDFIPVNTIANLKILKPVKPSALRQPTQAGADLNPAHVLSVDPHADWDTIRTAYRRLAKLYHPDRYASLDLPDEVAAYLDAKAKQINQAFRMLKGGRSGGA